MDWIGLGGCVENSGIWISKIPDSLGQRASAVQAGEIGKLCALSLAGVLVIKRGQRRGRNSYDLLFKINYILFFQITLLYMVEFQTRRKPVPISQ
jgi:hypothetical protein